MDTVPITFRVDKKMLKEFDNIAGNLSYKRAEAIRESMRRFVRDLGD